MAAGKAATREEAASSRLAARAPAAAAAELAVRAEVVSSHRQVLEAAAAEGRMAEAAVPQVEEAAAASVHAGR